MALKNNTKIAYQSSFSLNESEVKAWSDSQGVNQESFKHDLDHKGYIISDFLNREEVQYLLKLHQENPFPEDAVTESPYLYRSDFSSQEQYRKQVTRELKKVLCPKLETSFADHKLVKCIFICKPKNSPLIPLHQDPSIVDETLYRSLTIWCPLINVDERRGCLQVVEKSHLITSNPRPYFVYTSSNCDSSVLSLMQQHYLKNLPIQAGQAVIFDGRLFHGSALNQLTDERVVLYCQLVPKSSSVNFVYRSSKDSNTVEVFEVDDNFYEEYVGGQRPERFKQVEILEQILTTKEPNIQTLASNLSPCRNEAKLRTQPDNTIIHSVHFKQDLNQKGFTTFDFLSREEVQYLVRVYKENPFPEDAVTDSPYLYRSDFSSEVQYKERVTQEVKKIFTSKIEVLFPSYKIFSCSFICKQSDHLDIPLHQDPSVVDEYSQTSFIIWCPLIDVDGQNGCLQVIPKSHLISSVLRPTFMATCRPDVLALMKRDYLVDIPMKAGTALIFDSRLFHASGFNLSNRARLVISCCVAPQKASLYFYCQGSEENNQLKRYTVDDKFYDRHRKGLTIESLPILEGFNYDVVSNPPNLLTPEDLKIFMEEEPSEEIKTNPTTQENIGSLFNLLRGQDWWFYKIPPLLAIAYAEILTQDIPPYPSFTNLVALTVSMFCVAAYGHVMNDIFDIEVDKKAGKPNGMASLSKGQRTGLSLILAVFGLIPWWWIDFSLTSGILLAIIYLLLTVYPAPPLRLKERFVFGAVADATTVHTIPTLLVTTVFANLAVPSSPSHNVLAIIATFWAFILGVRGILLHQIWDRENDLKSGIQTLATKLGVETLRLWINFVIFPLEAILLTALVLVIAQSSPFFFVPCITYGLMLLVIYWDDFNPSPSKTSYYGKNIILHDFYEVWMPLSLLTLLLLHQPFFLLLLGVHIILFYSVIQQRVSASIHQVKLKLTKMNISQTSKILIGSDNQPQLNIFLSQPVNDLELNLVQAIDFLANSQLEDGEFPTYGSDDQSEPDSSPFVTALVLYSLHFLAANDTHGKVKLMVDKGLKFLVQAMEPGGLWRYWSSKNKKHSEIPPDLDDICCISHLLELNNLYAPKNQSIILGNKNQAGLFYTWILPRSIWSITLNCITFGKALSHSQRIWQLTKKDDICCVVNANILLYLGETLQTKQSLEYVIDTVLSGKEEEQSAFYNHKLSFYYMLSRAYFNGVTRLGIVKVPVITKISNLQKADGSFGNELLTALAISTLLNFNYISPSIDKAIQFLLNTQKSDGSWQRIPMYGGQLDKNFFGSAALTTGLCVEALSRYCLLNIPAIQTETCTTFTSEMQQELEENGYVILNHFLNEVELQDLQEFDCTHPLPEDITRWDNCASINTSDLSYRQQVNQKLGQVVSPKLATVLPNHRIVFWYRFCKKINNLSGKSFCLHQDSSLSDEANTRSFGLWFPLTDVNPNNGCLHVVKGSHHLNSKPRSLPLFPPTPYCDEIVNILSERYLTPISLKAGQAILYDKRIFHSSTANSTDTERVAFTGIICPSDQPSQLVYRPTPDNETVEIYEVTDDFYGRYILGQKPSGDGVTLIRTEPYTYDPLTPELIAERLNPLHTDQTTSCIKAELAEQHRQQQTEPDALQQQLTTEECCVETLAHYPLPNIPATQPETLTTLTPQMQQELEKDGYVILDHFLSAVELEDLREFDRTHSRPKDIYLVKTAQTVTTSNLTSRQEFGNKFKSIAAPKLKKIIPGYRIIFCTWFWKQPNSTQNATPLHQGPSLTDESQHLSLGLWCPLNDVDFENSCLCIVKGSHKLNPANRPFVGLPPYDDNIISYIRDHYSTAVPLRAGQAILFDKRLFHGASPNTSNTERIAATCFVIIPNEAPLYCGYQTSTDTKQLEIYEVPDDFYDNYTNREQPYGDGVTLIKTEPYTCAPLTPELIAEKLDPFHPEQAIPRLKTQLAEQQQQYCAEFDQLQQQITTLQVELAQSQQEKEQLFQESQILKAKYDNLMANDNRQILELEQHGAATKQARLAALIQQRRNSHKQ